MKKLLSFLIFTTIAFTGFSQTQIKISQVYGNGGNTGATYKNDFVELFNAGSTSVDITGWSVQYNPATGTTAWLVTNIGATPTSIGPGKYFLVQLASGGTPGIVLPAADATGTTNMSATAGKVAVVNNTVALTGASGCAAASVQDVVGFSTTTTAANCSEGTAFLTTGITAAQALFRLNNGCTDGNNNSADFAINTVNPRNSLSPANLCSAPVAALTIASNIAGLLAVSPAVSQEVTFTISGTTLTPAAGNLTVTSTGNVEISTTPVTGFSNSLTIPYTGAVLASTTLYARIKAGTALGAVSETITVSGGGAATSPSITASGSVIATEPTIQTSNIVFSNVTDHSFQFSWTNGDGASRIAIIKLASNPTDAPPADGTAYTANSAYGLGSLIAPSNYVVYSGSGSGPVTVTGLAAGTNYSVKIYEYNGTGASANYLTTVSGTNNPIAQATTGTAPLNIIVQQDFQGISSSSIYGCSCCY